MRADLEKLAEKLCPGVAPVERVHDGDGEFISVAYVFPMSGTDLIEHRRIGHHNGGNRSDEDGCVTAYFNGGYHKPAGIPVIVASTLPTETVPLVYAPFLNLPVADIPPEAKRFVLRSRAEEAQPPVDLDCHHTLYANVLEQDGKIDAFEYLKVCPHLARDAQTMVLAGIYKKEPVPSPPAANIQPPTPE